MPDYDPRLLRLAVDALRDAPDSAVGDWDDVARIVLDATLPAAADEVARKILAHMEVHGSPLIEIRAQPSDPMVARAWRRHFGIAARIAAGAFTTEAEQRQQAAEALAAHFREADTPEDGVPDARE